MPSPLILASYPAGAPAMGVDLLSQFGSERPLKKSHSLRYTLYLKVKEAKFVTVSWLDPADNRLERPRA